jgi:hypothetical protein
LSITPQHTFSTATNTNTTIMPIPTYGAAPLSKTFLVVRILQVISMIAIIGMTANFISMIVSTNITPPKEFVGTLSVVSASPTTSRARPG